jgi:hypothetical protein
MIFSHPSNASADTIRQQGLDIMPRTSGSGH